MKVEKRNLNEALRVLGKVVCQTSPVEQYRSVRFVGNAGGVTAMATDGVETVSVQIEAVTETEVDFCVEFRELKDLIRINRAETLELEGKYIEFQNVEEPELDAVMTTLPDNFTELLSLAAPIVNRNEYRRVLQGINLSPDGITATDGRQLLHLDCQLSLEKNLTIPFPSVLLAMRNNESGLLKTWKNLFQIEIGKVKWTGKLIEGQYPDWRTVIPSAESHDYSITLHEPEKVISWVKMIPSQKTTNGVELDINPDGSVTLISCLQTEFKLNAEATFTGVMPRATLIIDREILLRMLLQGYTTFKANSGGAVPVIASGGAGQYIAMPIRAIPKIKPIEQTETQTEENINKEEPKMEMSHGMRIVSAPQTTAPNQETETTLNPLDELSNYIEAFKMNVKTIADEAAQLARKVKEVQLVQKQKERDFIQAKRAIERIRMAI